MQGLIEDRELLHLSEGHMPMPPFGEKLQQLSKRCDFPGGFGRSAQQRLAEKRQRAGEHRAARQQGPHASAPQKS